MGDSARIMFVENLKKGKAHVNAFHVMYGNPYNMCSPYCPEAVATFKILKAP